VSAKDGKSGSRTNSGPKKSGKRGLKVRVKTARGRKSASTRWLQRQLNDPYVAAAQDEGYRSRAAFKLAQIDDKFHILEPGLRVLDLGAAPGGWTQVAMERAGEGHVLAVDLQAMVPLAGARILQCDLNDEDAATRIREALARAALDVVADPVVIIDEGGIMRYLNQAALVTFGLGEDDALGSNVSIIIPSAHRAQHDDYIQSYVETGEGQIVGAGREVQAMRHNGDIFPAHLHIAATVIGDKHYFVGTLHDLTEHKERDVLKAQETELLQFAADMDASQAQYEKEASMMRDLAEELSADKKRLAEQEQQLRENEAELRNYILDIEETRHAYEKQASELAEQTEQLAVEKEKVEASHRVIEFQALHDALTNLGNRALLVQDMPKMIEKAKAEKTALGFVYIDLDNFKPVNDGLGHDAGDDHLRRVSKAIMSAVSDEDEAIRLGGDEFAALIALKPGQGEQELTAIGQRLCQALDISVGEGDKKIETGASIGLALYPRDGVDMDQIIAAADKAMYEAKRRGKGQVVGADELMAGAE